MTNQEKWLELKELLKEIEIYGRCEGRAYFDMECIAPEEGIEKAGEDVALLSLQIFRLTHADRYIELLSELAADNEGLTKLQKRTVELLYDQYSKTKNIPEDFAHKMDLDGNKEIGRAHV